MFYSTVTLVLGLSCFLAVCAHDQPFTSVLSTNSYLSVTSMPSSPVLTATVPSFNVTSVPTPSSSTSGSSSSPYSVGGVGLWFTVTDPPQLRGNISFFPLSNSPSPASTIHGRLSVLNSADPSSGCIGEFYSDSLTQHQTDGSPFNGTVLVVAAGACGYSPAILALPAAAFIWMGGGLYIPSYPTFFSVPNLYPTSASDMSLLFSFLSSHPFEPVNVTITGCNGPLVQSERDALAQIQAQMTFTMTPEQLQPSFGDIYFLMNAPLANSSYDPCTSSRPVGGIYCENGHIVAFFLESYGLSGTLPSAFGSFPFVRFFSVSFNSLIGDISPAILCSWRTLVFFVIAGNAFTGLPEQCFQDMHALTYLWAASNQISVFPNSLLNTKDTMIFLDFGNNQISSFPDLSSFVNLQYLLLGGNNASAPMFSFSQFKNLVQLDLHGNRFTGSVSASYLDGLPSLVNVDISHNSIAGPVFTFVNTTALTSINIAHNAFTGDLPWSFSMLVQLTQLQASHNQLTVSDSPLRALPILSVVDLSFNLIAVNIKYTAGTTIGFMSGPATTKLVLDNNNIVGRWETGDVSSLGYPLLSYLSVSNNGIQNIPDDIFNQQSFPPVTYFDLSNNALTGSIPNNLPSSSVTFVSFIGNPRLYGPVLPGWIALSQTSFQSTVNTGTGGNMSLSQFQCPIVIAPANNKMEVRVDPTYNDYGGCECVNGYYGTAPSCSLIPDIVVQTSANITDEIFGDHRFSPGIDTNWVITAPLFSGHLARSISLSLTLYGGAFDSVTDSVTIYDGTALTDAVVFSIDGGALAAAATGAGGGVEEQRSTEHDIETSMGQKNGENKRMLLELFASFASSSSSASSSSVHYYNLTILNSVVTFNFKSKDTRGKHFDLSYTPQYVCPKNYQWDENINKCTAILPLYPISSALQTVVYIVSSLISFLILCVLCIVLLFRKSVVIRAAALPFCVLILCSLFVMSVGANMYATQPSGPQEGGGGREEGGGEGGGGSGGSGSGSEWVCQMRPWCTSTSVVAALALLLTKANRIRKIFCNDNLKELNSLSNTDLFISVLSSMSIQFVLLIVHSALHLSSPLTVVGTGTTQGYLVNVCHQSTNAFTAWLVVQFVYIGIILCVGLYIAWCIRKVPSGFNDSSSIVNCLYTLFSLGIIIVVVQFVVQDNPDALIIIRGLGQSIVALSLTLFLFGPKIYIIIDGRGNDSSMTEIQTKPDDIASVPLAHRKGSFLDSKLEKYLADAMEADHHPDNIKQFISDLKRHMGGPGESNHSLHSSRSPVPARLGAHNHRNSTPDAQHRINRNINANLQTSPPLSSMSLSSLSSSSCLSPSAACTPRVQFSISNLSTASTSGSAVNIHGRLSVIDDNLPDQHTRACDDRDRIADNPV